MKKKLDVNAWERKAHFDFFSLFDEPFFGVTVRIDCTKAQHLAQEKGQSFFLYYLYRALQACQDVEPFRYRIEAGEVFVYDEVHASPTISRPNGTFGFSYMTYFPDETRFIEEAQQEIDRIQQSTDLIPAVSGENVIHFSAIPWLDFTSISHARSFSFPDSSPKISFGKITEDGHLKSMPVSIHVHHGLMDAFHIGLWVDSFQEKLNADK